MEGPYFICLKKFHSLKMASDEKVKPYATIICGPDPAWQSLAVINHDSDAWNSKTEQKA